MAWNARIAGYTTKWSVAEKYAPRGSVVAMTKTSLLVVSHTEGLWGAQMRLVEYLPYLAEAGITSTLLAPEEGAFADAFRAAGGKVMVMDLGSRIGLRQADDTRPGFAALALQAKDVAATAMRLRPIFKQFDLIQSHSRTAHLEVGLAGRLANRPVVLDVHDVVRVGIGQRVLRLAGRLASLVVANSSSTALTLRGVRNVHVVNPAVDLSRFTGDVECEPGLRAELGGSRGRTLLGVVGRVDRDKRIELLFEAIATLTRRDIDIVVVGATHMAESEYLDSLTSLATELLDDRVTFAGPRTDMADVMACLDVLASVCTVEAFGRSILEAQASRVPVVAPDLLGVSDIVEHGSTGWVFRREDVGDLAAVLTEMLDYPDSTRVVETAHARAQQLGRDRQAQRLVELYGALDVG